METRKILTTLFIVFSLVSCSSSTPTSSMRPPAVLKVATWNMEHFAFPADQGCRPRSDAEMTAIKRYINKVDADIFGLQEVASPQALRQVFPADKWNIVLSHRSDSDSYICRESGAASTQQKVALVIKKSLDIANVTSFSEISLDRPGLRYGIAATVNTDAGPIDILALHLKSGCFVDDYRQNEKMACQIIGQQLPVLKNWIRHQEETKRPYLIMGDFNHRLSDPENQFANEILATTSPTSTLTLATRETVGCNPRYPKPIDHIWLGNTVAGAYVNTATVWPYNTMPKSPMLSDHCAVSVTIDMSETEKRHN